MTGAFRGLFSAEIVRFFTVASIGLAIDILVGSILIMVFGLADIPASAIGLFCGMISNYFMHLSWTFETAAKASLRHFAVFSLGVAVTLAIRAIALWALEASGWQEVLAPPVRLSLVAALAFVVSYAINRRLVFKAQPQGD